LPTEITLSDLVRLATGREAEVFALDAKRVLRLAFLDAQHDDVKREAIVLEAAHAMGAPVPTVHEMVTIDERPGLILERLDGPDLLAVLDRQPWLVSSVARTLGRVHASLHGACFPDEIPALRDQLRLQLRSQLVPDEIRERALGILDSLPDGDRLCHCDFHPGNVLRDGRGYAVIDWSHAARGDPAADVARTRLLLEASALPDDASPMMRTMAKLGRRAIVSGYLRSYHHASSVSLPRVARWAPVLAAARLAENIEQERLTMLALARQNA
jgi:aminoglycoside phosphotransferase (APT) family kinase protein